MNARGIPHSSIYVNAVALACAAELRELASISWDCVRRAHESCGGREVEKVLPLFLQVLERESEKLEGALQAAVGSIAAGLQNKSMVPLRDVSEARDHLIEKYKGEIGIYVANLGRGNGKTFLEQWTHRVKNNPVIAFASLVVAGIAAIAAFTDALGKLSTFFRGLLGDG